MQKLTALINKPQTEQAVTERAQQIAGLTLANL